VSELKKANNTLISCAMDLKYKLIFLPKLSREKTLCYK